MSAEGTPSAIGPYKILSLLGEGGMGTVHVAEQREPVHRLVALKVVKLGMDSKAVLARFETERKALALMSHPNIARVLDAGATDRGQPYFVMELVKGTPITEYCDRNRLSIPERIDLFQQVCAGVQHAHQKGVMHRDLKPTNVLVEMQDGKPVAKIIDFGLARATDRRLTEQTVYTEQGQIIGTPEYMSPEQAEMAGSDIDTRTDIYSLGVMLYELLIGRLPFTAAELRRAGYLEIQRKIREDAPPKPSTRVTSLGADAQHVAQLRSLHATTLIRRLRGDLDWITMKALEKDRTRRYQSATELAGDLERHLRNEPVLAGPPTASYRLGKLLRRYRVQVTAAALVLTSLVTGLVVAVQQAAVAQAAQRLAQSKETEASEALARFGQLADRVRLDRLVARARHDPWPEVPENVGQMDEWIVEAEALVERRPSHVGALAALRQRARTVVAGDGREVVTFSREEQQFQFLHDTLARLVEDLDALAAPGGGLQDVRTRREWARTVRQRTVVEWQGSWDEVAAAVRADSRFGGLSLPPQLGLVPIGKDRDSGLWEFAFLRSGDKPVRDAATGRPVMTDTSAMVLVLVPGGRFDMGAQAQDEGKPGFDRRADPVEGPVHSVALLPFFLSKYELTQHQWMQLSSGPNPSWSRAGRHPTLTLEHPVENVTWKECNDLLLRHGLCLPTEAQWELACRAGTTTPWWTGDERPAGGAPRANFADESAREAGQTWPDIHPTMRDYRDGYPFTAAVDTFDPNPFGLFNVLGNVSEWCRDRFCVFSWEHEVTAGDGEHRSNRAQEGRAIRGGDYAHSDLRGRSSSRGNVAPDSRFSEVGVRPARAIESR